MMLALLLSILFCVITFGECAVKSVAVTDINGKGCTFKDYEGGSKKQFYTYMKDKGGKACHFPFIYQGTVYPQCKSSGEEEWCAGSEKYDSNNWGNCQQYAIGTHEGNGEGRPCMFPFKYNGESKNECIAKDDYKWCATTSDYDADQKWGKCFTGDGPPTNEGNAQGQQCNFPFTYKGKVYRKCIPNSDYEWCAVTPNYDQDELWGKCIKDTDVERMPTINAAVPSCAIVEALGGTATGVLKQMPNAANGMMHSVNLIRAFDAFKTFAPKLAPCLGLLGVGFGILSVATSVSPAQIIGKVNEAFDELIKEIDQRFEQIKNFVEQEDLQLHERIKSDLYRADQRKLTEMLRLGDKKKVDDLLLNHVLTLSGNREVYMDNLKYTNYRERPLNTKDIKTTEMLLPILKKHVDLHLLALAALINTSRDDGSPEFYKSVMQMFVDDVDSYADYINWAYDQILARRVTDNRFTGNKAYTCNTADRDMGNARGPGGFPNPYMISSTQECNFQCTNMRRDFNCKVKVKFSCQRYKCWSPAFRPIHNHDGPYLQTKTRETVNSVCNTYLNDLETHLKNFWKRELMDYIPVWRTAANKQQEEINKLGGTGTGTTENQDEARIKRNALGDDGLKKLNEFGKTREKIMEGLSADMSMAEYSKKVLDNIMKIKGQSSNRQKIVKGIE